MKTKLWVLRTCGTLKPIQIVNYFRPGRAHGVDRTSSTNALSSTSEPYSVSTNIIFLPRYQEAPMIPGTTFDLQYTRG